VIGNHMLRTAVTLAHKRLAVLACRPRDKRPATANGLKDATTDLDVIRAWWRSEPQFNVAIATGKVSGIFVVDVDGLDAEAELRKLEAEHGALPRSVETLTGRGRHIYLKMPNVPVRNSAGKLGPGLDIRGDGGYCLVPPSIHPSGKSYCWSVDSAASFAAAPSWLLEKITEPNGNGSCKTPVAPSEWRALIADGVNEGARNDALCRLSGHLLRRRVDAVVVLQLLLAFNMTHCRPPLSDSEVEEIVTSICGRELKRRGAS
jgi:hypothetical protein